MSRRASLLGLILALAVVLPASEALAQTQGGLRSKINYAGHRAAARIGAVSRGARRFMVNRGLHKIDGVKVHRYRLGKGKTRVAYTTTNQQAASQLLKYIDNRPTVRMTGAAKMDGPTENAQARLLTRIGKAANSRGRRGNYRFATGGSVDEDWSEAASKAANVPTSAEISWRATTVDLVLKSQKTGRTAKVTLSQDKMGWDGHGKALKRYFGGGFSLHLPGKQDGLRSGPVTIKDPKLTYKGWKVTKMTVRPNDQETHRNGSNLANVQAGITFSGHDYAESFPVLKGVFKHKTSVMGVPGSLHIVASGGGYSMREAELGQQMGIRQMVWDPASSGITPKHRGKGPNAAVQLKQQGRKVSSERQIVNAFVPGYLP